MKRILVCIFLHFPVLVFADYKIAVVSATTGQTKICPTLDSAYNTAAAGDYIYLPAGNFTLNQFISKKIIVYGTGMNPDSSLLGITSISSDILLDYGSNNSHFEGIKFSGNIYFRNESPSDRVSNIGFFRCEISWLRPNRDWGPVFGDYYAEQFGFSECIVGYIQGYGFQWSFTKNVFTGQVHGMQSSTFTNNIFTSNELVLWNFKHSVLSNNIFQYNSFSPNNIEGCTFSNNINTPPISLDNTGNIIRKNLGISSASIFINSSIGQKWYDCDYHLAPGSPAAGAGTDGTDIGIYGTSQPTKLGWIPSNPHVYYKLVDGQNDASGVLKATFKVKAQSN